MGLSDSAWGEHEAGGQFDFEWSDKEETNTRNGDYFGMHSSLDPEPIPGGQSFGTALVREYILQVAVFFGAHSYLIDLKNM